MVIEINGLILPLTLNPYIFILSPSNILTAENPEATYFREENEEDSDEGHHFAAME